jgi:hypothetical protein
MFAVRPVESAAKVKPKPWLFISQNLAFEAIDTVTAFGPRGWGWSGIMLKLNSMEYDKNALSRARSAGFTTILGQMEDDALRNGHYTELDSELVRANRTNAANLVYLDDMDRVSPEVIVWIHNWLRQHNSRVKVAGATTDEAWVKAHAGLIDSSVSIIMPYRYTSKPSELRFFLQAIKKAVLKTEIIPILGFGAMQFRGDGKTYVYQTGKRGGRGEFLETAHEFSTKGWICYYSEAGPKDPQQLWRGGISGFLKKHAYVGTKKSSSVPTAHE